MLIRINQIPPIEWNDPTTRACAMKPNVFQIPNIRRFILFRVCFNARFYYPVFTVLFLDFGLTLEEFALLNMLWAFTVVVLEVPSGALADVVGRSNLLRLSAALMVLEMILLLAAPLNNRVLLVGFFILNRILSGAAEAAASGADEAMAYDTLKAAGLESEWGRVLSRQMQWRSFSYVLAMTIGAFVYDARLMTVLWQWMGGSSVIEPGTTLRLPVVLTLVMAVLALFSTIGMSDVREEDGGECMNWRTCMGSVSRSFHLTFQAGRWIAGNTQVLILIVLGLAFDHVVRMILTLNSEYYRIILLPEASFGLIGSGMALLGMAIPAMALWMTRRMSWNANFLILAAMTMAGLIGMSRAWPVVGLIPMLLVSSVMYFLNFFISHYMNPLISSEQRATVLSFNGLALHLAYGGVGLVYAGLVQWIRWTETGRIPAEQMDNRVFVEALAWFPWYFLAVILMVGVFVGTTMRKKWKMIHRDSSESGMGEDR